MWVLMASVGLLHPLAGLGPDGVRAGEALTIRQDMRSSTAMLRLAFTPTVSSRMLPTRGVRPVATRIRSPAVWLQPVKWTSTASSKH